MNKEVSRSIQTQYKELFEAEANLELTAPCTLQNGIISLDSLNENELIKIYDESLVDISFFIPASGSGSRMFQFLYEFLAKKEKTAAIDLFFGRLDDFAFIEKLPVTVREKLPSMDSVVLIQYLLSPDGMNFGKLPKGLIPFHKTNRGLINPFQEQYRQCVNMLRGNGEVHFTIQDGFEQYIIDSIKSDSNEKHLSLSFSSQDDKTNAFCFNDNGELVDGVRRPAGHGALLANLNSMPKGIILVKNIDNVQPGEKSNDTLKYWKVITGLLLAVKKELKSLSQDFSTDAFILFNDKYMLVSKEEATSMTLERFNLLLERPMRVCGMVINEGKPGGGPFWVRGDKYESKQIVEKSQIKSSDDQHEILERSTHFNPVFMALDNTNVHGAKVNLQDFVDSEKYLKVRKPHEGKMLVYRELPGLWNGSMANWNTIFVELPITIFSPVKSAIDLLSEPHV